MSLKLLLPIFLVLGINLLTNAQDQQLAFPGAEGFGKYTTGGRGGEIYIVTNLNDNGPGSLREGVEMSGPRIIIFNISGTIELKSELKIENDDISIFGQTAPGDGIATKGAGVRIAADNVIVQYMRFRPGDISGEEVDAVWGREQKDIILDHISFSWATDEVASFYDNENFTLQWSIISESLYQSVHGKGRHGYGGIWGGHGATFHHNLIAHHSSRNPRFNGSRYSGNPDIELVDFRNNVIYNWGSNSIYAGEGGSYNLVNNYFKPGPATKSNEDRIIQPWPDDGSNSNEAGVYGIFYIDGNFVEDAPDVTSDNWLGVDPDGDFSDYGITKEDLKADMPFDVESINTEAAQDAFESVLANAGAILPNRGPVDSRIIEEVETGNATYGGVYGSESGIIDSQGEVGGWPELLTAALPEDADNDGIPDEWEIENDLSPDDPSDAVEISESGYANIELYVHSIQPTGDFLPAPGTVELIYPIGESNISRYPTFEWEAASFASLYEFEIRNGGGEYADIIYSTAVKDTDFVYPEDETALEANKTYFWRVRGVNDEGKGSWSAFKYFVTGTSTSIENITNVPSLFALEQNYPNPFNPITTIKYALPKAALVDLRVYDLTGREIATLVLEEQSAGSYSIHFNSNGLASGVYIYKLRGMSSKGGTELFSQTNKMTLLK